MSNWRAVVFDLDDTLYPEREYVQSGMGAVAAWAERQWGFPAQETRGELSSLFESGSFQGDSPLFRPGQQERGQSPIQARGDTFDRWLVSHGLEPARWVSVMVEVYRLHEPQIAPYDGTPSLLDRLRVECVLGLVTDGFRSVQERKLDALRLGPYFQAVVFSDTLGRDAWKPSPRPFEAVLERLSVSGREAVYVADNPAKDFRGARCVGMATVRVRHADGLYHHLEASSPADAPDWEISQLGELETLLGVESARTGGRR